MYSKAAFLLSSLATSFAAAILASTVLTESPWRMCRITTEIHEGLFLLVYDENLASLSTRNTQMLLLEVSGLAGGLFAVTVAPSQQV